jgi:NAD(P)H dehydrogenase (quinone)
VNISIILGHPNPGSFNHAIAETAAETLQRNGHEIVQHDLCAERFDPLLPPGELAKGAVPPPEVQRHCDEIVKADGIVIVHPNWWGQPPAILKGWVDRVLRVGVAYEFAVGDNGEGLPIGLLKARKALVFTTSNTPRERERDVFGDPLAILWGKCVFPFCGVGSFERRNFEVVVASTEEERKGWLTEVKDRVGRAFPQG